MRVQLIVVSLLLIVGVAGVGYLKFSKKPYVGRGVGYAAVEKLVPLDVIYDDWEGVDLDGNKEPEIIIKGYKNDQPWIGVFKYANGKWQMVESVADSDWEEKTYFTGWEITKLDNSTREVMVVIYSFRNNPDKRQFVAIAASGEKIVKYLFPLKEYQANGGTKPLDVKVSGNGRISTDEKNIHGEFRINQNSLVIEGVSKR